jgi:lactate racemase
MKINNFITYELAYGPTSLQVDLPANIPVDVVSPSDTPAAANPLGVIENALDDPLNGLSLNAFSGVKSAAIAINDKTRPVPHHYILPPLLDRLQKLGIPRQNIKLIIATGTHKPMPREEIEKLLPPEIIRDYPVISHDCDDSSNLTCLGNTSQGTPVWINSLFWKSDLRIVTGNIEPHHFMGFSGGAKSLSIGLSGRETINKNHAMLINPNANIGIYEKNPMRQDVEEIGKLAGLQYALNVILNNKKEIVKAFAGRPLDVIEAGIEEVRTTGQIAIPYLYDIAVASVGGSPKDINLYQAQKAMTHAAACVRDGGAVILAAQCPEGSGSKAFEDYMVGINSIEEVFNRFSREGFRVGPHKAFQIARLAERVKFYLVSQLPDEQVRRWFITPVKTLNEGVSLATQEISPVNHMVVLPRATNTIPYLKSKL